MRPLSSAGSFPVCPPTPGPSCPSSRSRCACRRAKRRGIDAAPWPHELFEQIPSLRLPPGPSCPSSRVTMRVPSGLNAAV